MKSKWVVHKFGGTSVANAEQIRKVSGIVTAEMSSRKGIVVSAMSGVTDALIRITGLAASGNELYLQEHETLKTKHLTEIGKLLDAGDQKNLKRIIDSDFQKILEVLRGVFLTHNCPEETKDLIAGYGEVWLTQILEQFLRSQGKNSAWLDAREIVAVYRNETGVCIDWNKSSERMKEVLPKIGEADLVVITGFVAMTEQGLPTTLGRNGSDFSASIFGALLSASEITIWTDVDGVMTADPRLVPDAIVLESMSYQEATELAYFGAKVLHPSTMAPAIQSQIPIWIRNTSNSSHPGTKISTVADHPEQIVRAISVAQNMALLTVEGTGMIGVPGIAQRLFGSLREVKISVSLISQASSEHSICFAVSLSQAALAKTTLERTFCNEIEARQISSIEFTDPCSVLAVVGDGMAQQPGVAAKFFGALGKSGISIRAIAQGSSERNISAVIDQADAQRALRVVHSGFFLSSQTLSVGVIGIGKVGRALISQIEKESHRLKEQLKIDIRVRAISNSSKMLLSDDQIDLKNWEDQFNHESIALQSDRLAAHVKSDNLPHSIIIDCTADENLTELYPTWLTQKVHIICANKKANVRSYEYYQSLRRICKRFGSQFYYEANVGAGLPIISTLRDLIETGDKVLKMEGVLSGTLSFLFNNFDGSVPFSHLVKQAQEKGYTEPDPNEDLSGMDVARKLVILSREIGLHTELAEVDVENLAHYSDAEMKEKLESAKKEDKVLRYVGVVDPESSKIRVGIEAYSASHSFARLSGRDNIISFKTLRYQPEPLVIQGPGAGAEVTAAGVFSDLLRLAHSFGDSL